MLAETTSSRDVCSWRPPPAGAASAKAPMAAATSTARIAARVQTRESEGPLRKQARVGKSP